MATEISSLVRFLQQENARLHDENRLLQDEVTGLRRYIGALQRLQETVQCFTPEQEVLVLLDETLYCALALLNASDGSVQLVDEETGEFKAQITLTRLSGTREAWLRLNKGFVKVVRRHFLHWRAVEDDERHTMFIEARSQIAEGLTAP